MSVKKRFDYFPLCMAGTILSLVCSIVIAARYNTASSLYTAFPVWLSFGITVLLAAASGFAWVKSSKKYTQPQQED